MLMRNRAPIVALALCTVAGLGACKGKEYANRTDTAAMARSTVADSAAGMRAPASGGMTDANIAAILDVANQSDSAFGALAVRKGRSADVKQFGRLMMSEHHALRQQGQDLVKRLGVTPQPPANFDLPDKQRSAMSELEKRSGADFDKAYIDHQVDYHQQVLETAQNALGQAQNQELKNLIQQAAPVIQKHLDRAKEIQQKLGRATA
jgi:putative membrane protein